MTGWQILAAGLLVGYVMTEGGQQGQLRIPEESQEMAQMRSEAKQRVRRIIYNDDGCGPIWSEDYGNTPQLFLYGPDSRMGAVRGTQVDSVFICSGATHVVNHTSSVAESYADSVDRYPSYQADFGPFRDNMRALEALGTDAIQLTVDFCRKRRIEVFYTHRINDVHLAFLPIERSTWWLEHPEYWLGAAAGISESDASEYPAPDPRCWGWALLNFEIPEVREYLLSILEDAANRYDLDGLEIDYFRGPLFFLPNLELEPATEQQLDILTDFMRRVRLIAVRAGEKRGRPMLVAARVPTTVSRCQYVGIDIERWLKEDLLDVMSLGGGYVPFTMPTAAMVKLGHRYEVPVYPVISASGLTGYYSGIEGWRAAASNRWRAGADGVYLFNHIVIGPKPTPQFQELGDPQQLATMDKLFAIENDPAEYWAHYVTIVDTSAAVNDVHSYGADIGTMPKSRLLPVTIDASDNGTYAILPIGDDIAAAADDKTLDSAVLKVQLSDPEALDAVEVRLNGKLLTEPDKDTEGGWLTFTPSPSWYQVGENTVSFRFIQPEADTDDSVQVSAVEVHVKYHQG